MRFKRNHWVQSTGYVVRVYGVVIEAWKGGLRGEQKDWLRSTGYEIRRATHIGGSSFRGGW
jgi:hypothetical protein